mmetsp:Transcript_34982/g.83620  ORF Transcript_34982/g.83620 Transcript_34982/m.83620 type:complete len:164 (+) Transcript_34982:247-738(+)
MFVWLQALLFAIRHTNGSANEFVNINGGALEACSSEGMALTGWTRNGSCIDENDDTGSHHICINLGSIASSGENFCTVTGQSDWCSSSMTCHEDVTQQCPVQNWCVCQWAFASYIEKAGGCSAIQDIQCNAINAQALAAYEADPDRYGHALECLYERCILSEG